MLSQFTPNVRYYLNTFNLTLFNFSEEIIFKIYAAVITASDFDSIVINDFVNKESREFEIDFFNLLLSLEKSGKKILYLSTHMQQTSVPSFEKITGFKEFPLDFTDTSLR